MSCMHGRLAMSGGPIWLAWPLKASSVLDVAYASYFLELHQRLVKAHLCVCRGIQVQAAIQPLY